MAKEKSHHPAALFSHLIEYAAALKNKVTVWQESTLRAPAAFPAGRSRCR